jgi:hypothetical protein
MWAEELCAFLVSRASGVDLWSNLINTDTPIIFQVMPPGGGRARLEQSLKAAKVGEGEDLRIQLRNADYLMVT